MNIIRVGSDNSNNAFNVLSDYGYVYSDDVMNGNAVRPDLYRVPEMLKDYDFLTGEIKDKDYPRAKTSDVECIRG